MCSLELKMTNLFSNVRNNGIPVKPVRYLKNQFVNLYKLKDETLNSEMIAAYSQCNNSPVKLVVKNQEKTTIFDVVGERVIDYVNSLLGRYKVVTDIPTERVTYDSRKFGKYLSKFNISI